jgi:hypothetical protein
MKRTCDKCRALNSWRRFGVDCNLGFKIKSFYKNDMHKKFLFYSYKPLEECPKPLTINNYMELKITKIQ